MDKQLRELTYRLYTHLAVPKDYTDFDSDLRVQEQVSDRLFNLKKISRDRIIKDKCAFDDVKGCILGCIRRPRTNEENKVRLKARETMSAKKLMFQTTLIIKDISEEVARLKSSAQNTRSVSTPTSTTAMYSGGNLSYAAPTGHREHATMTKAAVFAPNQGYRNNPNAYRPPQARGIW